MDNILQALGIPELPPRPTPQKPKVKIVYRTINQPIPRSVTKKLTKKILAANKRANKVRSSSVAYYQKAIIGKLCTWILKGFLISFIMLVIVSAAMY